MKLCSWIVRGLLGLFVLAVSLWIWGNTSTESRARRGDADAQYELGRRYFFGHMTKRDPVLAIKWLRRAAEQGHVRAQTSLGLVYARGHVVPQNYQEALKWLRQAAIKGSALAQNQLGTMFAQGKGVDRDFVEAARWYGKAAEQGSQIACQNLALISAANSRLDASVTTRDGRVYRNAVVQKVEPGAITVTFQPEAGGIGIAKLKVDILPEGLQHRYSCKIETSEDPGDELTHWYRLPAILPRG